MQRYRLSHHIAFHRALMYASGPVHQSAGYAIMHFFLVARDVAWQLRAGCRVGSSDLCGAGEIAIRPDFCYTLNAKRGM